MLLQQKPTAADPDDAGDAADRCSWGVGLVGLLVRNKQSVGAAGQGSSSLLSRFRNQTFLAHQIQQVPDTNPTAKRLPHKLLNYFRAEETGIYTYTIYDLLRVWSVWHERRRDAQAGQTNKRSTETKKGGTAKQNTAAADPIQQARGFLFFEARGTGQEYTHPCRYVYRIKHADLLLWKPLFGPSTSEWTCTHSGGDTETRLGRGSQGSATMQIFGKTLTVRSLGLKGLFW